MKICYFGIYSPRHPRNLIFLKCLALAGIEVEEINTLGGGLKNYWRLWRELHRRRKEFDAVIVGFPGQQASIVARLAYHGPIVLNALLSLYDAVISDRKRHARFGIRAIYFWICDSLAGHLSDAIVLDCDAYIDYYSKTFGISPKKFTRIFFGADEENIKPIAIAEEPLTIHYYSSFIPSHGVEVIIRAAALLKNEGILFEISGDGQNRGQCLTLSKKLGADNVVFRERLNSLEELNTFINSSWLSLGIFSSLPKAERAIASKVFEALRCGRPVITSNSPASRELLADGENALLVKAGNAETLVGAILRLKNNEALRQKIARGGSKAYDTKASWQIISKQLRELLLQL
jgi:glycosyltransferase involved in cell wall biosynthesis